jgi:hypothetical protein
MKQPCAILRQHAALFFFITMLALSGCQGFYGQLKGDLQGKVLLRNTRIPIADVSIHVESLLDSSYFETKTNENGEYFLRDVHYGLNRILFIKKSVEGEPAYATLTKYADIRNGDTFILNVEMMEDAPSLLIYSTVKILDSFSGLPVRNATIDMYLLNGDNILTEAVEGYWDFYSTRFSDEDGLASFFLGALRKKGWLDLEARMTAPGYKDTVAHYKAYYQRRQEAQVFFLEPLL